MTWDADEQRLQLTEQVSYDRWQFLYDAAAGIPAVLVQRTADQDNTTLAVTVYVREPGGELLASFEPGAGATYYHFDALGSTVLLSDSSGNPDGAYAYGAWGDVLAAPATWQPYQYVGELGYYTHTASQGAEVADWLQLGVRFYQPELGRFERRDPVRGNADVYAYAGLMPTVLIDETGQVAHKPGGPYHPSGKVKCTQYDSLETILKNIKEIEKTIKSHEEWEEREPGKHAKELCDWKNALQNCKNLRAKRERGVNPTPRKEPVKDPEPEKPKVRIDPVIIGGGIVAGIVIIGIIVAPEITVPACACAAAL